MTDHAELRRLAKAATPGEWYAVWEEGDDTAWPNLFPIIQAENGETVIGNEGFYSDMEQDKANAQFCASANPKTILALLDEIDRLRSRLEIDERTPQDGIACRDETIKVLDEKCDRLKVENERLLDELSACTEHPGGCGYWREAAKRRAEERDRLKAENEALRGALQAVQAEVDGNLRPLTRDLVNMVSGLNNGTHPNDIYDHCDEIERIIGAALEGAMTDINKLKELAVRALPFAPGEWFVENGIDQVRDCANDFVCETGEDDPIKASFIAAANPQAILKLIAEVDLLSARLKAENCAHKDTQKHCELLEQYLKECASALPGTYYMDPPDGGDVSIPEQIRRMAKDAARYRWLRERDLETIRQGGVFAGMTPENIVLNLEHLDAAIDAALEGATQ